MLATAPSRVIALLQKPAAPRDRALALPRAAIIFMAIGITLLASLLRFTALATLPQGLYRDEAYNVLDEATISWSNLPVYFPDNSGREALFFYLQNLYLLGLGVSPLAFRLASTSLGVATVALQYTTMRRFFGWRTGVLAAFVLATVFWHVQNTRIGLRFTMTPFFTLATLYSLHWATRQRKALVFVIPGIVIGLGAHAYTSARVLPLLAVLFGLYVVWTDPRTRWVTVRGAGIGALAYAIIVAPLAILLLGDPGSMAHVEDVSLVGRGDGSGAAALAVARNTVIYTRSVIAGGDIQWLQNLSGRPVFDPGMALLCYAGLGILLVFAFWRASRPDYRSAAVLCLLALVVLSLPGLLSRDAPYNLRTFGVIPILALAPALALDWLWSHVRGGPVRWLVAVAGVTLLVVQPIETARDYFITWARAPEAAIRNGSGAAAIATYLRANHPRGNVFVSTYNAQVVRALAPVASADVVLFNADGLIPLPPDPSAPSAYFFDLAHPFNVYDPAHPYYIAEQFFPQASNLLLDARDRNAGIEVARGYRFDPGAYPSDLPDAGPRATFGDTISLLGTRVEPDPEEAGNLRVTLLLRAEAGSPGNVIMSLRAVDSAGSTWGQHDIPMVRSARLLAQQEALAYQPLSLVGGTPPGKLHVELSVWNVAANAFVPIQETGQTSVSVGDAVVSKPVPLGPDHASAPVQAISGALGGITLRGFALSSRTPRQGDALQLDILWTCSNPAPAGARLVASIATAQGRTLGVFEGTGGLEAPQVDRCMPGETILDRRQLAVGARWPADQATVQLSMKGEDAHVDLAQIKVTALSRNVSLPPFQQPAAATFAEGISLAGYTAALEEQSHLRVDLVWRATGEPTRDYTVFVHVLQPDGTLLTQHDGPPAGGTWPTSWWVPGQVVEDRHTLPLLGGQLPDGSLLEIGLYNGQTKQRLAVAFSGSIQVRDQAIRVPLRLHF